MHRFNYHISLRFVESRSDPSFLNNDPAISDNCIYQDKPALRLDEKFIS